MRSVDTPTRVLGSLQHGPQGPAYFGYETTRPQACSVLFLFFDRSSNSYPPVCCGGEFPCLSETLLSTILASMFSCYCLIFDSSIISATSGDGETGCLSAREGSHVNESEARRLNSFYTCLRMFQIRGTCRLVTVFEVLIPTRVL
jgi:hypothetical protein